MQRALVLCVTLAVTLGGSTAAAAPSGSTLPAPLGREVISYLDRGDYRSWPLWPGKSAFYKGRHPHGALLTTYVSHGAYQAVTARFGRIPSGEFVVKENFTADRQLAAITVMYKQDGYNVDGGDWFWLKYRPDGTILAEGKVGGCIGCHAAVKNNDWLFIGPVK